MIGIAYVGFLDWLCPPELMVSGLCTAKWHGPAFDTGVVVGAGLAAGLIMLTVILIAPSHRRLVAAITFAMGSATAMFVAHESNAWAAGGAAFSVGLLALMVSMRTLS